jgi:predicted PurR-regulated permease PerM
MDSLLPTQFSRPSPNRPNRMAVVVVTLSVFQTFALAVILCVLVSIYPEISNILKDVTKTLPEMKTSTEHLTWMVPEVSRAIKILDRICLDMGLGNCSN